MKAGTPDVVTVIEGAPTEPTPAPRREPRSWPRSGGISWDWGSPALVSDWLGGLVVFAVGGGVGPELEKEKEEEAEEVWEEEENEEEEDVDVEEEDVTVWPAVKKTKQIEISLIDSDPETILLYFKLT